MGNDKGNEPQVPVPLYAKIGWVVAWLLMVLIAAMILRNCATSLIYGSKTAQQEVDAQYQFGLKDGSSGTGPNLSGEGGSNPVLRKAYNKGYRDGIDRSKR